ncbi:cysteine desulfurase NifS [Phaeovulum vinaykumarii]|uniref:Cysteine desulfurase n=1 Tax=Phaeovulum vinaykumarii TaxID=407234 RepID=A0A1N7LKH0_9RHOB|nr:cysteine desulfurase NifS [Phaeovulum vinaykumarii]SIS74302.1 cysteine desulfurase [Phaeovulum vinaykumarii]SOC04970.1 cysteine desulfurase [Phaeovulum vinaykumarii]
MERIYLDANATTPLAPAALAAMMPYFSEHFGNPSSQHAFGSAPAKALRRARGQVAALLGAAREDEILFTSGGTEANATAIRAALAADPNRREIITSTVEHPAVLACVDALERDEGVIVHRIGVDAEGRLDLDAYRAALSEDVALVTLMWANNESGTIFPIEGLAEWAHEVGALFHTDAVQAAGKLPLDLAAAGVDMASVSAHKIHGPKGVGALYIRHGTRFAPLIWGGKQERGRRAGTENIPGIVGFGAAAEMADPAGAAQLAALRDHLETEITKAVPKVRVLGDRRDRLPNTSLMAFEFVEAEAVLMMLDRAGIAASSGSACSSGMIEPSHVLRAMDVPFTAAHGAIRISLTRETTRAQIDRVIAELPPVVARLREMSPFWTQVVEQGEAVS